jgi:hypothetical protein
MVSPQRSNLVLMQVTRFLREAQGATLLPVNVNRLTTLGRPAAATHVEALTLAQRAVISCPIINRRQKQIQLGPISNFIRSARVAVIGRVAKCEHSSRKPRVPLGVPGVQISDG